MKYKTIMLDVNSFAKLARAKEILRRKSGRKISFNDLVMELMANRLEFADIEDALKDLITRFIEKIAELDFVQGVMLFGSVANGTYNEYSDIDVLIVTKSGGKGEMGRIMAIASSMKDEERALMERRLPSLISPMVLDTKDLETFRPLYLDLADYGIILYEKGHLLSDFISTLKKKAHRREQEGNVEVLTWV